MMNQTEKLSEITIQDANRLDDTSTDEMPNIFSTIDLNGTQALDSNISTNESDLGYTSFGIGERNPNSTLNGDPASDFSGPASPQRAVPKSKSTSTIPNININLSSIIPPNLPHSSSVLSSAGEVSSRFATKTASTFETFKQWSKSAYKCTRQIVSEKLGKSSKTVDPELDSQIENLREVKRRYEMMLSLAVSLTTNFQNTVNTQKSLSETFAGLAQRSPELIEEFTSNSETQRQLVRQGEILIQDLNQFTSSLKTLCQKTMEDTLITIRNYEAARLEYDAYKFDLESLKSVPHNEQKLHEIANLEQEVINYREKYENLKKDVAIKIKFLDENRVKVMKKHLVLFQKAINTYFTGNGEALSSTMKQINEANSSSNPDDGSFKFQSFLEKQ